MKHKIVLICSLIGLLSVAFSVNAAEHHTLSQSAKNTMLYIIAPTDGAVVSEKVVVKFGLRGMGVAPAGTDKANTGHHHLLIDNDNIPATGVPMGANVKHFGGGQTETTLSLAKGQHTLQLVLGDESHIPHHPMVISEKITITVK